MPARPLTFRAQLAVVAGIAFVIRLAWVWGFGRTQEVAGDQIFYHYQGLALAQGDGFVNPYAWNDPVERLLIPTAAHPPLYSLYLAFWSLLGFESHLQHRIVSTFLGVACVVVVGLVGRRIAGPRAGILAAVAAAVYPILWINDGVLAAESAYALCVAVILLCCYRLWDKPSFAEAAGLGAAISFATLARAEGLLLFAVVALPLVAVLRDTSWRRRFELLVVTGVVGAAVLAPWVIRNLTTWDQPVLISNGAGFVIEISNCDATYSGRFLGYWSPECERPDSWPVTPEITSDMTQEEIDDAWQAARVESARQEPVVERMKRDAGMAYVRDHTSEMPKVVAARIGRMWDVWRPAQSVEFNDFFERRGRLPSMSGMAMYYVLLALSIYALVVMRRRRITIIPFLGIALTVMAAAASSFGITRYRVGVDVALCVLAGVAVAALWERRVGVRTNDHPDGTAVDDEAAAVVPDSSDSTFWIWLSGIGAVALVVRFANVLVLRPIDQTCTSLDNCFAINGDALYSHLQGELFAQGHGFASSFAYWLFGDVQPGAGDPPLYVFYLGLISGLHGSGGGGARFIALLVLAAAVAVAWFVGRSVGDVRTGKIAAAVTGGVAVALIAIAVLPGLGADQLGVSRIADGTGDTALTLPDGEAVDRVAAIDTTAVTAHRLASALAGAVGVVLLGLAGRRLGGARSGLIAAALAAIYPLLWINDAMVLSESLYVPMIALAILAGYRFWDRPDAANAVIMGAAIALAGLTRAEALLLGLFMAVPLVWGRRRDLGAVGAARQLAIAGGVCVLLVAPWIGFNMARFEEPTTMTAGTGAVLSAGSCDVAYNGEFVGYYGANCYQQYVDMGWEQWPDPHSEESVRDVPSRRAAVRYIRENIEELPRVAWFRVGRMWQVYKPTQDIQLDYQVEGRGRTASRLGFGVYAAALPFAVGGLIVLWRRRIPVSPLLAQAATVTLTAALTFGVTRYRVPADAALVLAAAVGADALLRHWWPVVDGGTIAPRPATASWGTSGPSDRPALHDVS